MKQKALFFFGCLLSLATTAWACPNLTGNYNCNWTPGYQSHMAIDQFLVQPITHYMITTDDNRGHQVTEFIADGRWYSLPPVGPAFNRQARSHCAQGKLHVRYHENDQAYGYPPAALDQWISVERLDSGALYVRETSQQTDAYGRVATRQDSAFCQ